MKWRDLLELTEGRPLFDASALLAGLDSPAEVRRQLSRWATAGRVIQLRRGLYVLAAPYARASPNLLAVAARMRRPSYVSLQSALAYHGVIPESVPTVTSVTTGRPGRWETGLGDFLYRHLKPALFWGYRQVDVGGGSGTYVAVPEKALLDLFYFTSGPIRAAFVRELRLAPDVLDCGRLREFAERAGKPKLKRAAVVTARVLEEERQGETVL